MTTTRMRDGSILHFPVLRGSAGIIEPPPVEELARIADNVDPAGVALFVKRLVSGAVKKRHKPRWVRANAARLELARLCLDRMMAKPVAFHGHDDHGAAVVVMTPTTADQPCP